MSKEWEGYFVDNNDIINLVSNWKRANPSVQKKIQDEIIRKLTYMVQSRIKRYKNTSFYEDLLQEGRIGIITAIKKFDIERGPNFFLCLMWYINNAVNSHLRWVKRTGNYVFAKKENPIVESAEENYLKQEELYSLIKIIDKLPSIDKQVIFLHFGVNGHEKHTFEQIGNIFSLSKQRIQQIESRAINKLKNRAERWSRNG